MGSSTSVFGLAAFQWLRAQMDLIGDVLPRSTLAEGFMFDGRRRRRLIGALLFVALCGVILGVPIRVAACQCMGLDRGDVVFTGTLVGSPNEPTLLHDIFLANSGVYTFDVESVERGDPLDGRAYSSGATCEAAYEVGATYRVHARQTPTEPTGATLAMGPCMVPAEMVSPRPPLAAIPYWALSSTGVVVLGAGLFLAVAGGTYLWSSRRKRRLGDAD